MSKVLSFILILFLFFLPFFAFSQVVINEVSIHNGNGLTDESGEVSDWIEIYNGSTSSLNLQGYSLSDGRNMWIFPNRIIVSFGFVLVYASGKDLLTPNLHCNFKLSSNDVLTLFDNNGLKLDQINLPEIQLDHSYGRQLNGSPLFYFFKQATPLISNDTSATYKNYVSNPVLNFKSGFYKSGIVLSISSSSVGIVTYTTDGSIPTDTSAIYSAPLTINTTTVIRTKAWGNLWELPSDIVTNTYFIDFETNLPVIAISTNPENLWDWQKGICVLGPNADIVYPYYNANFWQEWEIPIHLEYFEKNKGLGFEQDLGCQIHGGSQNRTRPMKSFRIIAGKKYDKPTVDYQLFDDKPINKFKHFVLRNGSYDFNKAQLRDGYLHKLLFAAQSDIDILDYQPVNVFLNGMFYGVEDVREKIDEYYLNNNYPFVDINNVDILEKDTLIIKGDRQAFDQMFTFITNNDLSISSNYDSAKKLIDIHSFCDYFIAETGFDNIDWPYNNIKYWRSRSKGSKWRYILTDLDAALGGTAWSNYDHDHLGKILGPYGDNNKHVKLLRSFLNNYEFNNYFINRYADLINTAFSADHMKKYLIGVEDELAITMPYHCNKWSYSMMAWHQEIDSNVLRFIEQRPTYSRNFIQSDFNLKKQINVNLKAWPPEAGTVTINSLNNRDCPWTGIYFNGNPIHLSAQPKTGYVFKEWLSENTIKTPDFNSTITLDVDTNDTFTAYFVKPDEGMQLTVMPNPATDKLSLTYISDKAGQSYVDIFDCEGRTIKKYTSQVQQGLNIQSIDVRTIPNGIYLVKIELNNSESKSKMVILHQ